MSTIEVKTNAPINNPFSPNYGNMGMNPYPFLGLQNYGNMNIGNMNESIQIVFNYKNLLQAIKMLHFPKYLKDFAFKLVF